MEIAIGSDHRGFTLKSVVQTLHVGPFGHDSIAWFDVGCFSETTCDYPLYAELVAEAVQSRRVSRGLLICSTGIGMAIAVNRFAGIYGALVWNEELARFAREHNNANVLILPANYIDHSQAIAIVEAWLSASFAGGRHQRRIDEIDSFCSKP